MFILTNLEFNSFFVLKLGESIDVVNIYFRHLGSVAEIDGFDMILDVGP
jgi:hypothetical protein